MLGAPGLPAIPNPRKAMFPVMNAVKTLPRARKLTASTAPDETVSMKRSQSRIPDLTGERVSRCYRVSAHEGAPSCLECMILLHIWRSLEL